MTALAQPSPSSSQQPEWKGKFAEEWARSRKRELTVELNLELLGIPTVKVGNGSGLSCRIEGYHTGAKDRFDLYAPSVGRYFECTGTDWTLEESAERYGYPILAVLTKKVADAAQYHLLDRLFFAHVCERQGEILYFPANECHHYDRGFFAANEKEYFLIPWHAWRSPWWVASQLQQVKK